MILYAITLKNLGRDSNGLPNYIWATKSQVDKIGELRNNPQRRYDFIEIGDFIFSPMDISHIEKKNTEHIGIPMPKYVIERYEADEARKLGIGQKNLL